MIPESPFRGISGRDGGGALGHLKGRSSPSGHSTKFTSSLEKLGLETIQFLSNTEF